MERKTSTVLGAVGHRRGAAPVLAFVLASPLRVTAGSPAIDNGHPFPGPPDVGAFERRV